ncbi:hypothetical protein [Pseudanabaena yagii]|uniref:Uncharacterized protein n=1 Tax=Pseudanabaena yagii GIHE-NHR1 TaxID=2722753 RepID=A0ABX1LWI8_9CYAN|nr:hypothetical protein [Pseudanabaena yagii]NMF59826.1 hypothetical protein [Pseudanabaena yagii GIHE-NHR1]
MKSIVAFLNKILSKLPTLRDYEIKLKYSSFDDEKFYQQTNGIEILDTHKLTRINYACGLDYVKGWLNVDSV